MKKRIYLVPALALALLCVRPMHAVNRDMVQLQTQIQQLQDSVARLQQSNDERMGVLKDLVQQTADSVNRMASTVDALQKHVSAQQDAEGAKVDTVSGQVQSLNDSVDELKARLGRIEKALADIQSTQQSVNAKLDSAAPAAGTPAPASPSDFSAPPPSGKKGATRVDPVAAAPVEQQPAQPAAPPLRDLYQTAYGDFVGAKYTLASAEFGDVVKFYPDDPLAGNAYFYLGEIDYKAGKFNSAAKNYDHVLEQYPGNAKIPVSHLRKGQSLIALKQNEAGIRELRSLIQRFPNSPEATQARSKLSAMGVPSTARR
ncbi:tetratricopeptide repeat protein [Terriglobus saanensis]|uniref:Transporter auxiliary protein, TonB-ExbB-ExbD/TolA-TolQ-TolR (TonB) family n=1 Tax=Terriglobus saanensis (strain ATCC BAA-1853 / DSM 23119 / SP1PR4) TaxID=401053 RepID=E8V793_TERSS|nr:tetratricopeptide repeat protein [Terriglobus saanensis]ADV82806.1 transporter auxiliary protein, TonB-ExbB-ExbD/TolA-TolQ-TolR (TonB) family [Terriglobus saanensis SP1PR4]